MLVDKKMMKSMRKNRKGVEEILETAEHSSTLDREFVKGLIRDCGKKERYYAMIGVCVSWASLPIGIISSLMNADWNNYKGNLFVNQTLGLTALEQTAFGICAIGVLAGYAIYKPHARETNIDYYKKIRSNALDTMLAQRPNVIHPKSE